MTILFNRQALITRFRNLHHAMSQRARPKLWKSGARKGKQKTAGLDALPFLAMDLMDYAIALVGESAIRCPYCVAIGRPANLIDLTNCVFDHYIPLKRGGTWALENLRPCCADCNQLKGEMLYDVFIGVLSAVYAMAVEDVTTVADRDYVLKCLRSHGVIHQFNAFKRKEEGKANDYALAAPTRQRTLDENF